ncbi:hypothetical protein [Candidatus Poriferisocius sp.]|uniref:hypothetical protein n=1 Tax=Candidatus Poriferisocius sp. TaxID=3101276 RepID=UPI003B5C40FE
MDDARPDHAPGGEDPLVECIRNGIYTAVGLGLLVVNRLQAARQDVGGQLPDDLRAALADVAEQVPEDVRNVVADLLGGLPEAARTVLSDAVEQAPALADALREYLGPR